MKSITMHMINIYKIQEFDFMGYSFVDKKELNYHHMIIPKRLHGPETVKNGAILNEFTSHPYLHLIENIDEEIFSLITCELVDQNIKGHLDVENLKRIRNLLLYFEKEHCSDRSKKGKILIKEEYITTRMVF